jgi:hypothetical protein
MEIPINRKLNRIRRVKCDEQNPSCFRCTSTGRRCDGYETGQPGHLNQDLSVALPGTRKERRAFEYFRNCTVPEFCGYFPEEFWERDVLQASVAHPALRHAIVALGALHEAYKDDLRSGTTTTRSTTTQDDINYFALSQYTKALSHLSRSLSRDRQQKQAVLMSCVVFTCFDNMTGDIASAITHLWSGLRILRNTPGLYGSSYFGIFRHISLQMNPFVESSKGETILGLGDIASLDDLPRFTSV